MNNATAVHGIHAGRRSLCGVYRNIQGGRAERRREEAEEVIRFMVPNSVMCRRRWQRYSIRETVMRW